MTCRRKDWLGRNEVLPLDEENFWRKDTPGLSGGAVGGAPDMRSTARVQLFGTGMLKSK